MKLTVPFTAAVLAALMLTACGKEGPMGPQGPAGTPGVALLNEHTGTLSSAGDYEVEVPEITGLRSSTFVEVYWALDSAPDIWTLMSDGWKDDSAESRTCAVSWTYGKVYLFGMQAGDHYYIKVFQHQ